MESDKCKAWNDLGGTLYDEVLKGIESLKCSEMTPLQTATIPLLLQKKDVVVEVGTNRDKTALVYLIPLLKILLKRHEIKPWAENEVGAIVIAPRSQIPKIRTSLGQLLEHIPALKQGRCRISYKDDFTKIRNGTCQIIVCTREHLKSALTYNSDETLVNAVKSLEVLILDDADGLLTCKFKDEIKPILKHLPKQRCTGLFSTTLMKLDELIDAALCNPVRVEGSHINNQKRQNLEQTTNIINMESNRCKTWSDLGVALHDCVLKAIESLNYSEITPLQTATIPLLLQKKDVTVEVGIKPGKALAYLIPLLEILLKRHETKPSTRHEVGAILILSQREEATRINNILERLLEYIPSLQHLSIVRGSIIETLARLRNRIWVNGHIIVCTATGMNQLLKRSNNEALINAFKSLEVLIVDTACSTTSPIFMETIEMLLTHLPKQRCTGLFSTNLKGWDALIGAALHNPVLVSSNTLENYYIVTRKDGKLATLVAFLDKFTQLNKALLFLPTLHCVAYWSQILQLLRNKMQVFALTANAVHSVEDFKKSERGLLLCNNVQAKRIDIPQVDCVIQWDPPKNTAAYEKRVQYAARQGQTGTAVTLLLPSEEDFVETEKRVELMKMEDPATDDQPKQLMEKIRNFGMSDVDLMEMGARAFNSHVQTYSKALYKDLPLNEMATCYGFVNPPEMPKTDVKIKNRPRSFNNQRPYNLKGTRSFLRTNNQEQQNPLLRTLVDLLEKGQQNGNQSMANMQIQQYRKETRFVSLTNKQGPQHQRTRRMRQHAASEQSDDDDGGDGVKKNKLN